MAFTFGVFCTIVLKCTGEKVLQKHVVSAFVQSIDPDDQYWQGDRKSQISKLVSCDRDFSVPSDHNDSSGAVQNIRHPGSNVAVIARNRTTESIVKSVCDRVMPLLDPDKSRKLIFALKEAIRMDKVLPLARTRTFIKYFGCDPATFLALQHLSLTRVISAALLYCLIVGHNEEGKVLVSYFNDETNWANLPESFLMLDEVDGDFTVVDAVDSLHGFAAYVERLTKANKEVRLCLPQHPTFDFDKLFVCNDICVMNGASQVAMKRNDIIPNPNVQTFLKIAPYTILTAIGGIGKTMMLKSLLFDCVRKVRQYRRAPFLINLRGFSKNNADLFTFIFEQVHEFWPELDHATFHSILKSGRALLLLDGLDEITNENYQVFPEALRNFLRTYPNNQVIMSSRPIGNDFCTFPMFKTVKLMNFTLKQILKLIDNVQETLIFLCLRETFKKCVEEELFPTYPHLVTNPLMLTVLIPIYNEYGKVPLKASVFFSTAFDVMVSKHDFNKDGYVRVLKTGLSSESFKDYLCELCAASYFDETFAFTQDQLYLLYDCLDCRRKEQNPTTAKAFVEDLCVSLCLMYQEGLNYRFIHRSFQEYFCALFVASQLEEDMIRYGKSTLMLAIAAMITQGIQPPALVDGHLEPSLYIDPSNIFYVSTEDESEDTALPRFLRNGGVRERYYDNDEKETHFLMTEECLQEIYDLCHPSLIIIDPFQSFLPDGVHINNVGAVRNLINMMGRFAATHNTAIVLVGHMNKNESSKDIYRGFGSADIGATVRNLLKVDIDKDDKSIRTIRAIKSNFDDSCFDPIGIEMDEEKRIKLYDMSPEVPDRKLAQAVAFFQTYLKDGMKPFSEVMAAQTDAGIKERTGRRARHIAKVKKVSRNGVDYLMLSNRR